MRTVSALETEQAGARLAETLQAGDVVLVTGELGAGKTTFVRGALRALGVTGAVTSPTFTLGRRYDDARLPASHLDLHRLSTLDGEDPALLDDYLDGAHVGFVEWPQVAEGAVPGRVVARVHLAHAGGDAREIEIDAAAP